MKSNKSKKVDPNAVDLEALASAEANLDDEDMPDCEDDDDDDDEDEEGDDIDLPSRDTETCSHRIGFGDGDEGDDEDEESDKSASGAMDNMSFAAVLREAKFPFNYDSMSDTFSMNYEAGLVTSLKSKEMESAFAAFGTKPGNGPDFYPTDDELSAINSLAGRKMPKESYKVYYTYSADTDYIESHGVYIAKKGLESSAILSYDKPVTSDHNMLESAFVFGKIFDSKVMRAGKTYRLIQKMYVPNTERNAGVIEGFEYGTNNKLSMGIGYSRLNFICNSCKKPMFANPKGGFDWCGHIPGMVNEDGTVCTATITDVNQFRELSRVLAPAIKKAKVGSYSAAYAQAKLAASFSLSNALSAAIEVANDAGNSFNESVAKISSTLEGDEAMSGKAKNEPVTQVTAPETATPPAATSTPETETSSASETISKIVEDFGTGLSSIKESFELVLNAQNATAAQIETSLSEQVKLLGQLVEQKNSLQEEMAARDAQHQKQVAETRELLLSVVEAHKALAIQCGYAAKLSVEEMTRNAAAAKSMPNRIETEKKLNAKDGGEFYKGTASQFV